MAGHGRHGVADDGFASDGGGFASHGGRVRTMVEIARRLGVGARTGALQGNFGTVEELGLSRDIGRLATLQEQIETLRAGNPRDPEIAALQARADALAAKIETAATAAKPGNPGWAGTSLDVNRDGVVDGRDLAALEPPAASS